MTLSIVRLIPVPILMTFTTLSAGLSIEYFKESQRNYFLGNRAQAIKDLSLSIISAGITIGFGTLSYLSLDREGLIEKNNAIHSRTMAFIKDGICRPGNNTITFISNGILKICRGTGGTEEFPLLGLRI